MLGELAKNSGNLELSVSYYLKGLSADPTLSDNLSDLADAYDLLSTRTDLSLFLRTFLKLLSSLNEIGNNV